MLLKGIRAPILRPWAGYALVVALLHVAAMVLLIPASAHHPVLIGMGFLAYTFGLRHAFDVDHIAAIDNTVRKLVQQKRSSEGVGFFFSLGHSTVVACMTVVTVVAVHFTEHHFPTLQRLGGLLGTAVSGVFLLLIGVLNLVIWLEMYRLFIRMRTENRLAYEVDALLQSRGFLTRFLNPLFKLVNKSWHIYPVGFLFGLGFDTASEVALLAVSAMAAKNAIPLSGILSLPLLFAAGMSLLDTADGVFMTRAYGWAFSSAVRKVYYNLSMTGLGVFVALLIGLIELAQVLIPEFGLDNGFWAWLEGISLANLGYLLVALFVLMWVLSIGLWKWLRIGERWMDPDEGNANV